MLIIHTVIIVIDHIVTDLTLGTVEATGTGANVGLHACSSIQTDGVTESCRYTKP